jgi:hypothetical protein
MLAATSRLKQAGDSKDQMDAESQKRIQTLTKEKDELLSLAMSRGKLIQVWPTLGYTFLPRLEFCYDEK